PLGRLHPSKCVASPASTILPILRNVATALCSFTPKHRTLYGLDKPKAPPKPKKEMPFKASRRHEYWSIDIRYIEHHQLPNIKGPVYVISILENFLACCLHLPSRKSRTLLPTSGYSPKLCVITVLQRLL